MPIQVLMLRGRVGRAGFLATQLGTLAVWFLVAVGSLAILPEESASVVAETTFCLALWPILGNTVRRLHDLGKGGAYALLGVVPLLNTALLLYLLFSKGQLEANRFGPGSETGTLATASDAPIERQLAI